MAPAPGPKRPIGLAIGLIAAMVAVIASVAFAVVAYNGRDGGTPAATLSLGADEDTASASEEVSEEPSEEPSESPAPDWDPDSFEIPDGFLGVASLGALTREPGLPFQPHEGPGAANSLAVDVHSHRYLIDDTWQAYFAVGRFNSNAVVYDPADLTGTAEAAVEAWADSGAFGSVTGMETERVDTDRVTIDGRTGAMTSWLFDWDSSESTSDTYEYVSVLLVDVDGEGWICLSSVPESAEEHLELTVAMVNTTFAY